MGLTLLVIEATPAWPQAASATSNLLNRHLDATGAPEASSSTLSANELAKEISSNPVTSLWQLQFQFNNVKLESSNFEPCQREVGKQSLFSARATSEFDQRFESHHAARDYALPQHAVIPRRKTAARTVLDTDNGFRRHDPGASPFARPHRAVDFWQQDLPGYSRPPARILPDKVSGRSGQPSGVATSRTSL